MRSLAATDFEKEFPFQKEVSEHIRFLLTAAVRAPSTHNCQPWRFRIDGNRLYVYRDASIKLPQSDSVHRYAYISIGFLLHHIRVLGEWLSMAPRITRVREGDCVAEIVFSPAVPGKTIQPLVAAIFTRRNRRGNFGTASVPHEVIREAAAPASSLFVAPEVKAVTDKAALAHIAEATSTNMKRVYAMPPFRREMASWITPNHSSRKSGIPGYSLNQPAFMSWMLPTVVRWVNIGAVLAKLNRAAIASAAAAFGFGADDTEDGWLSVGYAASHAALTLVSHRFDYSVFIASVEYADTRESVGRTFGLHKPLEFLFVAGKIPGNVSWMTPRVPVADKLISS